MASLQSKIIRHYVRWASRRTDRSAPIEVQRREVERATRYLPFPRGVEIKTDQIAHRDAEWLIPQDAPQNTVMLYLHGGGYAFGSPNTHRALVARIARASEMRVLLLDYRLAPEHPFPAALHDAANAYCALLERGYAPENILIAGDSAGGGLALSTLLWLRENGTPLPATGILMSPFTDLTASGDSINTRRAVDPMNKPDDIVIVQHYVGNNDPANPMLSPLFADLAGLPPLYIQVGDDEIMRSDSTRFAAKAKRAGVDIELKIWHNMWHVWQFFAPFLPEATQAIDEIGHYVRTHARVRKYSA